MSAPRGWTESRLRAPVPDGWFVRQSITLLDPTGGAQVIVSCEPLAPDLDTGRYAAVQGDLLRDRFPGYVEEAFTVVPLAAGPAYLRLFSWTPPDGVAVRQHQIYYVEPGTGFTATATSTVTSAHQFADVFDDVLRRIEIDGNGRPSLAPPAPVGPGAERPACAASLSLPPDGMPPPIAGEVPGAVDRLVVAAADALEGSPRLRPGTATRPGDAWDVAALGQECDRLLSLDGAVPRVLAWADAAASDLTGPLELPGTRPADGLARTAAHAGTASGPWREAMTAGSASTADLVWATGLLVTTLADRARTRPATDEDGLAATLDRVTRRLPDPDAGWAAYTSGVPRHPRYALVTKLDPGSGHLLWSGNDATTTRWDYPVDHFDLPIPLALARRIADLLRQYDATNPHLAGPAVPSVQSSWNAFLAGYRVVVPELRHALGPAYAIEDRIAP